MSIVPMPVKSVIHITSNKCQAVKCTVLWLWVQLPPFAEVILLRIPGFCWKIMNYRKPRIDLKVHSTYLKVNKGLILIYELPSGNVCLCVI